MADSLTTPCIGICSTIYGDVICRGCFRHYQDVIDWNTFEPLQKSEILTQLDSLITSALQDSIDLFDVDLLHTKCLHHQVKIRANWSPYTWAHALLRAGIGKFKNPEKYGFHVKPHLQNRSIPGLVEYLDDLIFEQAKSLSPLPSAGEVDA